MTRDELLARLRELKPWLAEQGVVNVRLFGSFARDEAGPDSDVDLLVDLTRRMDAWTFMGLQLETGDRLGGRKVEMLAPANLKNPVLRRSALSDAVAV